MFSIDKYRGIHKGTRIAVLGSSPTLSLYHNEEDIAIAVNGAPQALNKQSKVDYFMCGDKDSYKRQWFLSSQRFNATRIVSSFVLPFDEIIIPDIQERKKLQKRLMDFESTKESLIKFILDDYILDSSHGFFYYSRPWNQEISRDQKRFAKSCTITGVASQMALVMGAEEIHLYGCSFGDVKGNHYSYDAKDEPGEIKPWQPTVMDFIIYQIIQQGVRVYSHGFTTLRMPEKH